MLGIVGKPMLMRTIERHLSALLCGLVVAVGALTGCNKLWGIDYLDYDGEPGGGATTDTGATGGTGGGAGLMGGAGGWTGQENCLNGIDDDGDQLADCDDPNCLTVFMCADLPPAGWGGPGWVVGAATSCPTELPEPVELHELAQLDAPAGSCNCTCGVPTNVKCNLSVECWLAPQCGGADRVFSHGARDGCMWDATTGQNQDTNCRAQGPGATFGECAADLQGLPATADWPATSRACLATAGGWCSSGGLCIRRQGAGAQGPCIVQVGDHPCPAPYTELTTYYDGDFTDTRGCSACTCGDPAGGSCSCQSCGVNMFFGANACSGSPDVFLPANGGCVMFNTHHANLSVIATGTQLTDPGACAPSSSVPTGQATPTGPITVCCLP